MFRNFGAAAVFLVLSMAPAMASSCIEPIAPAAVDGTRASEQQMKDAIADFKQFQGASDDYQSCLIADLQNQKTAAAKAKDPKPLDPSIEQGVEAKIDANQKLKEKVGGELNGSIQAYKTAHPGK
jgi:hypothetical protein